MSVLVLGAGGQVGSALRWTALARGTSTVGLRHDELDIVDGSAVRRIIADLRPAAVVNCAAYTAVDRAEDEPERAHAINADGAGNVAVACALEAVPLIHLSTDYVFDGEKRGAWVEDDPVGPVGVYARTKEEGERQVRDAWGKHLILRTSWVFGAIGTNFVKTMWRLADEGRTRLSVVHDQRGGPTPADAIAGACLDMVARIEGADIVPWGTYHFAGSPAVTWYDFARVVLADRKGLDLEPTTTAAYGAKAPRPANSVLDCGRIRAAFGIEQPDWRVYLERMRRDLGPARGD